MHPVYIRVEWHFDEDFLKGSAHVYKDLSNSFERAINNIFEEAKHRKKNVDIGVVNLKSIYDYLPCNDKNCLSGQFFTVLNSLENTRK